MSGPETMVSVLARWLLSGKSRLKTFRTFGCCNKTKIHLKLICLNVLGVFSMKCKSDFPYTEWRARRFTFSGKCGDQKMQKICTNTLWFLNTHTHTPTHTVSHKSSHKKGEQLCVRWDLPVPHYNQSLLLHSKWCRNDVSLGTAFQKAPWGANRKMCVHLHPDWNYAALRGNTFPSPWGMTMDDCMLKLIGGLRGLEMNWSYNWQLLVKRRRNKDQSQRKSQSVCAYASLCTGEYLRFICTECLVHLSMAVFAMQICFPN